MTISQTQLDGIAGAAGFRAEPLEKVLQLLELLNGLRSHPFLADRLVLKGGSALNLFILDMPRLSVDIDVNYVGALDRETMLTERPRVEQAIQAVCARQGLDLGRMPTEHAGGKWRLRYTNVAGRSATLELDVNFLLRSPLWEPVEWDSLAIGEFSARRIRVVDLHELAAGKLAALFGRDASRDLFDIHGLLGRGGLDQSKLRLGFVLYGAMSRRDWRTVTIDDVRLDAGEVEQRLLPLLRTETAPSREKIGTWADDLVRDCRELVSDLLPFTPEEREFLELLNGAGEVAPHLLTDDSRLQDTIRTHPALLWKAVNVRRHGKREPG